MRFFILLIAVVLSIGACANKNIIRPGDTLEEAFEKAKVQFEKGKYAEAASSFETVLSMGRGTAIAEEAQYMLAESYFENGEFLMASSEYERFLSYYPRSEIREEIAFKEAYCFYELSPRYKLDQSETNQSIEKLQLFMNRYPNSAYVDSSVVLIDIMRDKLARKSFETAKLYKRLMYYEAAAIYFGITLDRFPETKYSELSLVEQAHSYVLLATNSVPTKKVERFEKVISTYEKYIQIFPTGKNRIVIEEYLDQAKVGIKEAKEYLDRINPQRTAES